MKSAALKQIDQFRRKKLQDLLDQCTEAQQNMFIRMYRTADASKLPEGKLDWAIQQCERTVNKNKRAEEVKP